MGDSSIEWTLSTWNPVTGCTKVSPGCAHCYAERMSRRLAAMGSPKYANVFSVTLHEGVLERPLQWRKPQLIFVNSMSDLFHPDVPVAFIQQVISVISRASWHTFQILTKRSERLLDLSQEVDWPLNLWMGVSVENSDYTFRIDHLRETSAAVKFLSLEPLLGPLPDLDLQGIDWAIVGGESGPGARPLLEDWVTGVRDRCTSAGVPFFFKQWGGVQRKRNGRMLQGQKWEQMPTALGTTPAPRLLGSDE